MGNGIFCHPKEIVALVKRNFFYPFQKTDINMDFICDEFSIADLPTEHQDNLRQIIKGENVDEACLLSLIKTVDYCGKHIPPVLYSALCAAGDRHWECLNYARKHHAH